MAQNAEKVLADGKVRIQHVSRGWHDILCSSTTAGLVDAAGAAMADRAGEGFSYHGRIGSFGGGRYIGTVNASTKEARTAEAEGKALTQAVM